jgi:G3E family GTPase
MIRTEVTPTPMSRIPVTIISGFAQAGKTDHLIHVLEGAAGARRAVIMNDIAEVVSGYDRVRAVLTPGRDTLLTMPNGCICCTLAEQFLAVIRHGVQLGFDHIFVESNATAEPLLLKNLLERASCAFALDIRPLTTVVDAHGFFADYQSGDDVSVRGLAAIADEDRSVAEVLAEQIEHADILVLRHVDRVSSHQLHILRSFLASVNPTATIACQPAAAPLLDRKSIERLEFRSFRPFHPARFERFLQSSSLGCVLRAEGAVWIASRHDSKVWLSLTGCNCTLESDGEWWGLPEGMHASEVRTWFEQCGSRYQDIVFHGMDLGASDLSDHLRQCLLTDEEMLLGPSLWQHFPDALGHWEHVMDRSCYLVPVHGRIGD